jgi:hypothetical protein
MFIHVPLLIVSLVELKHILDDDGLLRFQLLIVSLVGLKLRMYRWYKKTTTIK